jgi:hypothetical protein
MLQPLGIVDIIETCPRYGQTEMIVSGKYELLDVLHESGIRTYRARQVALGHLVMVHFIPGTETEDDFALLEQLAELPDSERKLFFDAGEHESVPYLVSWPLPGFHSLPDWLERTLGEHRVLPKAATRAPETARTDPSEFSRLFFRGLKEPAAESKAAGPELGPGEFTQLFQKQSAGQTSPPSHPKNQPGEFTALFQAPSLARPTASHREARDEYATPRRSDGPSPASGPGEFTQFFQGDFASAQPQPAAGAPVEPVWSEPRPAKLRPPLVPDVGPPAQPPHDDPLDPFQLPPIGSPRAWGPPQSAVPRGATEVFREGPSKPLSSPQGPGEYTMVLGPGPTARTGLPAPVPPPALPTPPPPAAASTSPAERKPNYRLMWIGLAALLLLALALVLFFSLAR